MKEKLEKKREKLKVLYEKKGELEKDIAKLEAEINDLELIETKKKFDKTNEVISSNGLSLDEVLSAIQKNDFSSLQEKLKLAQNKSIED